VRRTGARAPECNACPELVTDWLWNWGHADKIKTANVIAAELATKLVACLSPNRQREGTSVEARRPGHHRGVRPQWSLADLN
jgi:hypothetical protein